MVCVSTQPVDRLCCLNEITNNEIARADKHILSLQAVTFLRE